MKTAVQADTRTLTHEGRHAHPAIPHISITAAGRLLRQPRLTALQVKGVFIVICHLEGNLGLSVVAKGQKSLEVLHLKQELQQGSKVTPSLMSTS